MIWNSSLNRKILEKWVNSKILNYFSSSTVFGVIRFSYFECNHNIAEIEMEKATATLKLSTVIPINLKGVNRPKHATWWMCLRQFFLHFLSRKINDLKCSLIFGNWLKNALKSATNFNHVLDFCLKMFG